MGEVHNLAPDAHQPARPTTALLILALLQRNSPRPMSTYELGLWIKDEKNRPLSIIVKTLAEDGYIARQADAGRRAGLWALTHRGAGSLQHRKAQWTAAEAWLTAHPHYSDCEIAILLSLKLNGPQTPKQLAKACALSVSPARTAVKRLVLRRLITRPRNMFTGYSLNESGVREANALSDDGCAQAA